MMLTFVAFYHVDVTALSVVHAALFFWVYDALECWRFDSAGCDMSYFDLTLNGLKQSLMPN